LDISLFPLIFLLSVVFVFRCGAAIDPLRSGSPAGATAETTEGPCSPWFLVCCALTVLQPDQKMVRANGSLGRLSMWLDPHAEKTGPTLLTGTSNKDRGTMRDIINAGRRDKS